MPAAKLRPVAAEDDNATAGHVFTGMITDAFDHRLGTTVANAEPLGGYAAQIAFAAGRTVEHHVADEDVFFGFERDSFGG